MTSAAVAAWRLLSGRASSSSLSALLRRDPAATSPEQSLLRPAVVAAASRLGFPREIDEESSNKLEGLPGVHFVLPDSCVDPRYKDHRVQYANLFRAQAFASWSIPVHFHQLTHHAGISTTRNLLADDAMMPISSPLTPPLGDNEETNKKGAVVKRLKVQAIKKDIKQSPKKVNLVAKLVRGMRVEDALLQLQVTVKRAAKTVYQVIHSARANAAHNHGLDSDKLIVEEAFVGKGLYLKRLSYHAKGKCGVMVRPRCRLTVVVREATAEEEAKIAKLRVSNYKKLTRKERQLMPHRLIEVSPRWARKRKEEAGARAQY